MCRHITPEADIVDIHFSVHQEFQFIKGRDGRNPLATLRMCSYQRRNWPLKFPAFWRSTGLRWMAISRRI